MSTTIEITKFEAAATTDPSVPIAYLGQNSELRPDGCWEWMGPLNKGEPCIRASLKNEGKVYKTIKTTIMKVIHNSHGKVWPVRSCGYERCINPEHIVEKTTLLQKFIKDAESQYIEGVEDYLADNCVEWQDPRLSDDPCWLWQGASFSTGYPVVGTTDRRTNNIKKFAVHRLVATAYHGGTEGKPVHHACANRACLNPDHLQIVSDTENTAEMLARNYYETRIETAESLLSEAIDHMPADLKARIAAFLDSSAS